MNYYDVLIGNNSYRPKLANPEGVLSETKKRNVATIMEHNNHKCHLKVIEKMKEMCFENMIVKQENMDEEFVHNM